METIIKKGVYRILQVFYENGNKPVHLREIARRTKLNANSVSRFLNFLVKSKILISKKEESVRKINFSERYVKIIFPLFDSERFEKISFERRKSVEDYISSLEQKPCCLIIYGSTSRGSAVKGSDIDILEINNSQEKISGILNKIEAQRGIKLQVLRISLENFKKSEKDLVIKSALETGFPVFGKDFFYEVIR